jgi:hypothetical protein
VYSATVLDLCPRRLLGYAFSNHHDAKLTEAALQMVVATRICESRSIRGVVFHREYAEVASTPPVRSRAPACGRASPNSMGPGSERWMQGS